jgi:hypothetical protein
VGGWGATSRGGRGNENEQTKEFVRKVRKQKK